MCRKIRAASSLGLLGVVLAMGIPATAIGQGITTLHISAVLATKERGGFDPRLEPLRADLRSLPFKDYSLLAMRSCEVSNGGLCAMDVPASGSLRVTATECSPSHLKLHLVLDQGHRSVINADLKLSRNAGVLIKSTRTEVGTVLISIKATAPPPEVGEAVPSK
jgi:hypothetical protein